MKKKLWLDKLFSLSLGKIGLVVLAWFVCVVLHNLVFAWFGFEEPLFFVLAVIVIPVYFFFSVFYSLCKWVKTSAYKKK